MHEYRWKGLDLSGKTKRGKLAAENPTLLKEQLLNAGIALLSYSNSPSITQRFMHAHPQKSPIQTALINFFEYFHHLLESGIPLSRTLELVTDQNKNQELGRVLQNITQQVKKGEALSVALKRYPETFSPIIIQLIASGEKTGNLVPAVAYLNTYLKEQSLFKKTIFEATIFPLFTLGFALIIIIGILLFIVPQFEVFFSSMNKTLPPLTATILNISIWIRSWNVLFLITIVGLLGIALKFITTKSLSQNIVNQIPFLRKIIATTNLINVLHILSLFLKSGIPLKESLETICSSIKNPQTKNKIQKINQAIIAGQNLTNQLSQLAPPEDAEILSTLISLGEKTGKLDTMLDKAAIIFEEKLKKHIARFTLFFQPVLLIIIGLIIALLMAAVYLPLFNLAYSVS